MDNNRRKPVAARPYQPGNTRQDRPAPSTDTRMLLIVGAVGLLAAVWLVGITWLSSVEDDPIAKIERAPVFAAAGKNEPRGTSPNNSAGPWEKSQSDKQRESVLDLIQSLTSKTSRLDGMSPELWAGPALGTLNDLAESGDIAYQEKNYDQAASLFGDASTLADKLTELAPAIAHDAVELGFSALAENNVDAAKKQFELALAIDPGHERASAGLDHSLVRSDVEDWITRGEFALKVGDLGKAHDSFTKAVELDGSYEKATRALANVKRLQVQSDLGRWIQKGFDAVERDEYDLAISAFNRALKIDSGSQEAERGRRLAISRQKSGKLASLYSLAETAESEENWTEAISRYSEIQTLDPLSQPSSAGLSRSRRFHQYHQELTALLAQPKRLASTSVSNAAQTLSGQMAAEPELPPSLSAGLVQLRTLTEKMSTPVSLTIVSDGKSEIAINRVSRLGMFTEKTVELKYGTYVLVARRDGFVDKRVDLDIPVDSRPISLRLICDEPI